MSATASHKVFYNPVLWRLNTILRLLNVLRYKTHTKNIFITKASLNAVPTKRKILQKNMKTTTAR